MEENKDYTLSITSDGAAVVMVKDNTISLIKTDANYGVGGATVTATIKETEAEKITIIDYTNGSILYYATGDSSKIKLASYSNAIAGEDVESTEVATVSIDESNMYFDLSEEENCLYFFKTAGKSASQQYLHRIKVNNNLGEAEEMFGVYDADDVPEVEEEEVEEEEEQDLPILFFNKCSKKRSHVDFFLFLCDKQNIFLLENYFLVSNGIQEIRENGFGRENIPAMMAAVVAISLPLILLFLIFRNKIMEGVARGGLKG